MFLVLAASAAIATSPCAARDIVLSTEARDGDFNGMSHSGVYLIVRNKGARACSLPGLPVVTFYDRSARAIAARRQAPRGMHPGPVVVPATVPGGGSVATGLRWVSAPVFDQSSSYEVGAVGMTIAGRLLRTSLRGTMYGQARQPLTFTQPPLVPLPPVN